MYFRRGPRYFPGQTYYSDGIHGLRLLESRLVVVGAAGWAVLDMAGNILDRLTLPGMEHNQGDEMACPSQYSCV